MVYPLQEESCIPISALILHREFASGLTYTALSRTTKLQNIRFDTSFDNLFPNLLRFKNIFRRKKFEKRLQEERRLAALSIL